MDELFTIIQFGFSVTIPLLLLTKFVFEKKRSIINKWFLISNCIVFLMLVYLAIYNGFTFFEELISANSNAEGYSFYYSRINISSPYGWTYYFFTFSPLILSALYLFKKKVRALFVWSICVILLFNIEPIIIYITDLYGDYLPSSWSVQNDLLPGNDYLLSFLFFNVIVAIILFIQNKFSKKVLV